MKGAGNAGNCTLCGSYGSVGICGKVVDAVGEKLTVQKPKNGDAPVYCNSCRSSLQQIERLKNFLLSSEEELGEIATRVKTLLRLKKEKTNEENSGLQNCLETSICYEENNGSSVEPIVVPVNVESVRLCGSPTFPYQSTLQDPEHTSDIDIKEEDILGFELCPPFPVNQGSSSREKISTKTAHKQRCALWKNQAVKFQCYFCIKIVKSKQSLERHLGIHTNERRLVNCPDCNETFTGRSGLKYHKVTVHGNRKEKKEFRKKLRSQKQRWESLTTSRICYFCGMTFASYRTFSDLEHHMKLKHTMEFLQEKCRKCNRVFLHKRTLQEHERLICFPNIVAIQRHKSNRERLKRKKVRADCYFCKRRNLTTQSLETHMLKHTDEEPVGSLKCEKCNVIFAAKRTLNNHVQRGCRGHPPTKGELRHRADLATARLRVNIHCYFCSKILTRKDSLKLHMRIHTKEKDTFNCINCRAIFFVLSDLKFHNTAPCEKPVDITKVEARRRKTTARRKELNHKNKGTCFNCGKLVVALPTHLRKCSYRKQCTICNIQFLSSQEMLFHLKTVHRSQRILECYFCDSLYDVAVVHVGNICDYMAL